MATLELQRPQRPAALATTRRSPSTSSTPLTPSSPTIIRTPQFILLPSVPTHEPEDNLPSPQALQQQFALAAQTDAAARRSRANSLRQGSSSDEPRTATSSRSELSHHISNSIIAHDSDNEDQLEEMADPTETAAFDYDPAAAHNAIRDVRNQQLESLQRILHSIAETHFEHASSSTAPHSEITQILDDMFASLRRIGGHNAPLSPTFARSALTNQSGFNQISDVQRFVLLVDRLTLAVGNVEDARQAGLLANLNALTHGLVQSDRRMARAAVESPPRTPRTLHWSESSHRRRRSSYQPSQQQQQQQHYSRSQHSPQSSTFMSEPRRSWSSHGTPPTSSDEALVELQQKEADATKAKRSELLAEAGLLSSVPEQQHIDPSVFDMATVRQSPSTTMPSTFSIETLYARQPPVSGLVAPQSPRSDQASGAASVGEKSDSTALPNRKRFSVQTDSAASTLLPGYSYHAPGYHAVSYASQGDKKAAARLADQEADTTGVETADSDDLPGYDGPSSAFASDSKKALETPTLLERRRAKLAAQHSAYAARTPEDLAMVQSSIDRMSTVMPQLDNQRALSPEQQREAQLNQMIGRLADSNAKRLNDQRSNPPSFKPSRPAPSPRIQVERTASPAKMPRPAMVQVSRKVMTAQPESEMPATLTRPTRPCSQHSGSNNSRIGSSLLPSAFNRKLSIASIGNALRRASLYDTTKVKPKEAPELNDSHSMPTSQASTVRRRAATQHSRSKSDIAETLTSLFNEGSARINGKNETSVSRLAAQTGFRAVDFADDTPRGRDASLNPRASVEEKDDSLNPRASVEEKDDSMLDNYSFAKVEAKDSNHRFSVISTAPDSPRSRVSMMSSGSSHTCSRRSSHMLGSNPATPTWPKPPLTSISPIAPKKATKTTATFAADTLAPPPSDRSRAAWLRSQLRENGLSPLGPGKSSGVPASACLVPLDSFGCASASTSVPAAATSAFAGGRNDLIVYSLTGIKYSALSGNNAADKDSVSATITAAPPSLQSKLDLGIEYFAEAQHTLGSISVLLWTRTQAPSPQPSHTDKVQLDYTLVEEQEGQSWTLHVTPVDANVNLDVVSCARESSSENERKSSSGSGGGSGEKRKLSSDHVSSPASSGSGRVRIQLAAAATWPQSGRISLALGGGVCRVKLSLTEAERRAGAEESRAEGIVDFPLSASYLSAQQRSVVGLCCAVCAKQKESGEKSVLVGLGRRVEWRALPSEGWEELVDAWMCHGDQELNRSLTETAVRFSSKIQAGPHDGVEGEQVKRKTIWVGDTYLLLPRQMLDSSKVAFETQDAQTVMRCSTCHSALGEVCSGAPSSCTAAWGVGSTIKLSKYLIQPLLAARSCQQQGIWIATLLSSLQYSATSHGARRFLLHSCSSPDGVEVWLFSRACFTTSLAHFRSSVAEGQVWKGYRILFRTAQPDQQDTESVEPMQVPDPIYNWTLAALKECNTTVPAELRNVVPGWDAAYLATQTSL
ncbi:uncharacterized protein UDID_06205 [Ustilago sp. UG-2017a]|nr:uncharacterized protein UDID_06205 [Ustilago sp. UG-2017a]